MADIDTDAAGILIGDGLDVPTAIAASYRPQPAVPHGGQYWFRDKWIQRGALLGLIASLLYLLF